MNDTAGRAPDGDTAGSGSDDTESAASSRMGARFGGSLADAVRAGASGEQLTAEGLLKTIGGWRGIAETVVPALLFLGIYVPTQNARLAALVPGVLAVILVILRLVRREPVISALSGMLGVGVAVLVTLVTGRGVDYYLSGFVVNAAWAVGLFLSILVGWPALGVAIGALSGDLKGWRRNPVVRRAATLLTLLWLVMFVARLVVQLPLYLTERVEALGLARLAMGVPLFALVIVVTWFAARRYLRSSDDSSPESLASPGEDTPSR